MAETAPWRLGADGRWVAEVGALGSLVVWMEPSGYRWSMAALGTERGGYLSAVAAKAAAVREARQQLVAGCLPLSCWTRRGSGGPRRKFGVAGPPGRPPRFRPDPRGGARRGGGSAASVARHQAEIGGGRLDPAGRRGRDASGQGCVSVGSPFARALVSIVARTSRQRAWPRRVGGARTSVPGSKRKGRL